MQSQNHKTQENDQPETVGGKQNNLCNICLCETFTLETNRWKKLGVRSVCDLKLVITCTFMTSVCKTASRKRFISASSSVVTCSATPVDRSQLSRSLMNPADTQMIYYIIVQFIIIVCKLDFYSQRVCLSSTETLTGYGGRILQFVLINVGEQRL